MKMPTADDIRLACGELTAQEMRTAKAVLTWFIATRSSEADQRDAARYRFLKASGGNVVEIIFNSYYSDIYSMAKMGNVNAAIDAAMSARFDKEESNG